LYNKATGRCDGDAKSSAISDLALGSSAIDLRTVADSRPHNSPI
jgi:hypothetical protein